MVERRYCALGPGGPGTPPCPVGRLGPDRTDLHRSAPKRFRRLMPPFAAVSAVVAVLAALSVLVAPSAHAETYSIQPGDSLTSIALKFKTTVATLRRLNPAVVDANKIRDGRVIEVPGPASAGSVDPTGAAAAPVTEPASATPAPPASAVSPATPAPGSENLGENPPPGYRVVDVAFPPPIETLSHVVLKGETLSSIARRNGTSVGELAAWNSLKSSNRLAVGQTLQLRNRPTYQRLPPRLLERSERLSLMGYFDRSARAAGVDAALLKGLAFVESGWQPGMISVDGAIGVTQLMPGTAAEVASRRGDPTLDPYDPVDNIELSAWYLRSLIERFQGNTRLAVTAYYQGHQAVRSKGPSRRGATYARAVLSAREKFFTVGPTSQR
jgi:soluble lytic murein transglycosylase-like protein